jgi:cytochrome P450
MERGPLDAEQLSDDWCMHRFDYLSEQLAQTMPDTMARMRALCPVAHSAAHDGFWVVSGYEQALTVAQDWQTYSSAQGGIKPSHSVVTNLPVEADPPVQRVFKQLISPYFTPAAVSQWEQPTRDLVTRLIDAFIDDGTCEFMDAFARPLPSLAFFELAISAPADDLEKVARLASASGNPTVPNARESWLGLYSWIKDFIEARRGQAPRGDVVDAIIGAQIDGRPIAEDEVIGAVQLLILGGLETTAGALGLMLLRLCAEPDIAARLRDQPGLIQQATHELLRLDTSFVSIGRTAVRDTELGGHSIRAGNKVLIHLAAANRDAGEFPHPDGFDLDRERNRHLGFGVGPHRCLGSNLAKMNLRVALEELLRRMDDIRLVDGAEIRYHAGMTRSPLAVPLQFTRV